MFNQNTKIFECEKCKTKAIFQCLQCDKYFCISCKEDHNDIRHNIFRNLIDGKTTSTLNLSDQIDDTVPLSLEFKSTTVQINKNLPKNYVPVKEFIESQNIAKLDDTQDLNSNREFYEPQYNKESLFLQTESLVLPEVFDGQKFKNLRNISHLIVDKQNNSSLDELQVITVISSSKHNIIYEYFYKPFGENINIPAKSSRTKYPTCIGLFNKHLSTMIFDTENLHKSIDGKTKVQDNLLLYLIEISDVLIFTEDEKYSNLIRIRDVMQQFKNNYLFCLQQIDKFNPKRLLPGIIYMRSVDNNTNDDLPTMVNKLDSETELFCHLTDVVNMKSANPVSEFETKLKLLLDRLKIIRKPRCYLDICDFINDNIGPAMDKSMSNNYVDHHPVNLPNSWFYCSAQCEICKVTCLCCSNHQGLHDNNQDQCKSQPNINNKTYSCKMCYKELRDKADRMVPCPNKREQNTVINLLYYTVRGDVLECEKHKLSVQMSDFENVQDYFITFRVHKWPYQLLPKDGVYPQSRYLVDKLSQISTPCTQTLSCLSALISTTLQPSSWQDNSQVTNCPSCELDFSDSQIAKHHCRPCGKIFCSKCLDNFNNELCCKQCKESGNSMKSEKPSSVFNIFNEGGKGVRNYIMNPIKEWSVEYARPVYWQPDNEAKCCPICKMEFHWDTLPKHHCRSCGKCVCDKCSRSRYPIPSRGIYNHERVCNICRALHYSTTAEITKDIPMD